MRRRFLILFAAAILAGFSAVAVVAYARGADRRALEGKRGTWVLLATGTIPADTTGAQIRAQRLVRQVMMPAEAVPDGALSRLDDSLDDIGLNAALQPDQMLLRGQFGTEPKATPSAVSTFPLPANRIGVAVKLGIAPQVAGNVSPGDKVTVFYTFPREPADGQQTYVLLARVTVISVGEAVEQATQWPTPSVTPAPSPTGTATTEPAESASPTPRITQTEFERYVVTLAVTQSEGERLILASNSGLLHLGLLGPSAKVSTKPVPVFSEADS